MISLLTQAVEARLLRNFDLYFAKFIATDRSPPMLLLSALLSMQVAVGHSCLPLQALQPARFFADHQLALAEQLWQHAGNPTISAWREALLASPAVGDGTYPTPLVLSANRLYLHQMWQNEQRIAQFFLHNTKADRSHVETEQQLSAILTQLFPTSPTIKSVKKVIDWQKIAVAIALTRRVAIISGGPGTGKTTTIAKLIVAFYRSHSSEKQQSVRIQLVAPTGKAAAHLTDALHNAYQNLDLSAAELAKLPIEASTIHRLIAYNNSDYSWSPLSHLIKKTPLSIDLLVIDEASMVDLALMARLIARLPDSAQCVLVGDRDQLASVEAGSVFADVCQRLDAGYSPTRLQQLSNLTEFPIDCLPVAAANQQVSLNLSDSMCELRNTFRFTAESGIGQLAQAIKVSDLNRAQKIVRAGDCADLLCRRTNVFAQIADYDPLLVEVLAYYHHYFAQVLAGASLKMLLHHWQNYQLLCALRQGPYGTYTLNQLIEERLQMNSDISSHSTLIAGAYWYPGKPIIIEENDYNLGLFNGDIGIALLTDQKKIAIHFLLSNGNIAMIHPQRLPKYTPAYAMTIHKAQGSEFNIVALLLPNTPSPFLTRELLYTGITRARQQLILYLNQSVLAHMVNTPTVRFSGLAAALWP